jgi:hypothetical protein
MGLADRIRTVHGNGVQFEVGDVVANIEKAGESILFHGSVQKHKSIFTADAESTALTAQFFVTRIGTQHRHDDTELMHRPPFVALDMGPDIPRQAASDLLDGWNAGLASFLPLARQFKNLPIDTDRTREFSRPQLKEVSQLIPGLAQLVALIENECSSQGLGAFEVTIAWFILKRKPEVRGKQLAVTGFPTYHLDYPDDARIWTCVVVLDVFREAQVAQELARQLAAAQARTCMHALGTRHAHTSCLHIALTARCEGARPVV